jgi:hypothetical protein
MSITQLIDLIHSEPENLMFEQVMETIAAHYDYTPAGFSNGIGETKVVNEAGTNEGSCKVFAFAQMNDLTRQDTLICFGQYYRDVLNTPDGSDHANIRNFMRHGWDGIHFDSSPLSEKAS